MSKRLDAVLQFYGKNDGKGPKIKFADLHGTADSKTVIIHGKTTITFDPASLNNYGNAGKAETIAHEGTHGIDDHKPGVGA